MRANTEVRIAAEIASATPVPIKPAKMRPALNGVPVEFVTILSNGIIVKFTDGTSGYFSRSAASAVTYL